MRTVQLINRDWRFCKENVGPEAAVTAGELLDLPHTWNALDGQDGGNDYYRGTCWYSRRFAKPDLAPDGECWVEFRGVNSSAEVWCNGTKLATHHGGYSTFRVDLTDVLAEENVLVVSADNAPNDFVYPQRADFTFYGGIYRDVYLLTVPANHFALDCDGGPGIWVTPVMDGATAHVRVQTEVAGSGDVRVTLLDRDGTVVGSAGGTDVTIDIPDAHLWHGRKDPYLYRARAELLVDGAAADCVETRFGCRSFRFDAQKGFFLNGEAYPLRGVSRHQDRVAVGNALTPAMHAEDMALIAELGANTIRLAHYQHDQYFYDLCDEYGMVVWAEIPYISNHMPAGRANTLSQMTELIRQNYNHPSIVTWGIANEICLNGEDPDLKENLQLVNDLCHRMDATRVTTSALVFMMDPDSDYVEITDIAAWNLYFGWYVGKAEGNEVFLDEFHANHPNFPIGLSEYGAEAVMFWQTSNPTKGDYSEAYQAVYHEHMAQLLHDRPWIWGSHVWNMFDFAADARDEGGEAGMNHKGLVTFDRKTKKDAYYLYRAWWSDEPFVHLCSRGYIDRCEAETEIKVYSNLPRVALYDNGRLVAEQDGARIFKFRLPLTGEHRITVRAGGCSDVMTIRRVAEPNPAYTLAKADVVNWFDKDEDVIAPEGFFSVLDNVGELMDTEEGAALISALMNSRGGANGGMQMKISPRMQRMMLEDRTIIDLVRAGGREAIQALNAQLNRIPKPQK